MSVRSSTFGEPERYPARSARQAEARASGARPLERASTCETNLLVRSGTHTVAVVGRLTYGLVSKPGGGQRGLDPAKPAAAR